MAEHSGSLRVIIAAIAGNVAIAISKFGAALVTGSAAMYSEAIHSTVDTGNELLLLFGMRRADKPPDAEHPFGYGLQLYFWVFVVAVMIFGLGALVAFYEGVEKILHAEPARYVVVNYNCPGRFARVRGRLMVRRVSRIPSSARSARLAGGCAAQQGPNRVHGLVV